MQARRMAAFRAPRCDLGWGNDAKQKEEASASPDDMRGYLREYFLGTEGVCKKANGTAGETFDMAKDLGDSLLTSTGEGEGRAGVR